MLCFKVEMHVSIPAEQTFHLLADLRRRKEWDQHYELVSYACFGLKRHLAHSNLQSAEQPCRIILMLIYNFPYFKRLT